MPVPLEQKIGDYQFVSLNGRPVLPSQGVTVVRRDGVDGVSLWRTGRRGQPFRMISAADFDSYGEALRVINDEYSQLQGADPVAMILNDFNYEIELNYLFGVLNVQPARGAFVIAEGSAAPGISTNPRAICQAVWTLIAIDKNQP